MRDWIERAERTGPWLAGAALILAAALGLWRSGDPWELGNRGITGGAYFGTMAKHALRDGLAATHGLPVLYQEPTDPPTTITYANHPPLAPWLVIAGAAGFGLSERALRATALALFLTTIPALYALARRFVGPLGAGLACLVLVGAPMGGYYGLAVDFGCIVVPSIALAALALARYSERPSGRRLAELLTATALGVLADWPNTFVALVLPLLALTVPGRRAGRWSALWTWVAAGAALAGLAAYLAWAVGGWSALHARLTQASRWIAPGEPGATEYAGLPSSAGATLLWREAIARSAEHAWSAFTWPVLALAALGLIAGTRSGARGRAAAAAGAVLLLPGALNVLVFPWHSLAQEFWTLPSACGVALLAAIPSAAALGRLEVRGVARSARIALVLGATLAAVAAGAIDTWRRVESSRTTVFRDVGELLDTRFGRGDLLLTDAMVAPSTYYVDACLIWGVASRDRVERALEHYAPLRAPGGGIYFVLTPAGRAAGLAELLDRRAAPAPWSGMTVYALGG